VPLVKSGTLIGVLDIDSPRLARFDEDDRRGVERLAATFLESISLESIP
jgi:GAF domain-containing protein